MVQRDKTCQRTKGKSIKILSNLSKLKNEKQKLFHGHYIQDDHEGKDDWQFTLIEQCTTNAELRKRELYWQHCFKRSFQMTLISVKNFVYNKLARQNICIFLINSISVLVFLTYCYHYLYPYSCYCYYCYCFYYFIIITTIFYCCYSHYYCSQYFISMLFILSHFISYCSYYYDLSVCRVCDMYISSNNFVFFPLLMIYILHSYCLYMLRIIFLLSLSFI